jgi:hypothetical protein
MKREAKLLLDKAINSLLMSVGHFNQVEDRGRSEAVLIFLDHSFEMLLKASIVERGGSIREKGKKNTIGFDHCVRKGLTDGTLQFLTPDQALSLQAINNYRDAAQHYILDISEQLMYIQAQTGLTLFRSILKTVFNKELADYFPTRVLPVSTVPIIDIAELFYNEVEAIRLLLQPGKRQQTEALARLRPLAIMEEALQGQNQTPSDSELGKLGKAIRKGKSWSELFPGVASIEITSTGYGPSLEMRIVKKEGIPIQFVEAGTPNAGVIAIKRVNELEFYSLNLTNLCSKTRLTSQKCLALIWHLGIRTDLDCYKEIKINSQVYKRYSPKALEKINNALTNVDMKDIWERYKNRNNNRVNEQPTVIE